MTNSGDYMSIVGFNFTKINAERKRAVLGTVNISNNITLKEVAETKLGIAGPRGALRVSFLFRSTYTPELAILQFEGDVLMLVDAKQSEEILGSWNKNKQLPKGVAEPLINHILDRCNIQALLVAKDLNLPSPVPLPKVRVQDSAAPEVKSTKVGKKK